VSVAVESQYNDDVEPPSDWPGWQQFVFYRFCGCSFSEAAERAGFSGAPSPEARKAWRHAKRIRGRSKQRLRREKVKLEQERQELEAELEHVETRLEVVDPKLEAARQDALD